MELSAAPARGAHIGGDGVASSGLDARALLSPLADLDQLVDVRVLPGRPGRQGQPTEPFDGALAEHPATEGLWRHQAMAIDLVRDGRPVVVATGTGSGKSRCFQLPIAEAAQRGHTALVVFPTKALAHDQRRAWAELALPGIVACTYDGDSDDDERTRARRDANVVLTNPEMLHYGLCANHDRWRRFLSRVRYVVIDELHALRGVFGSHVGNVIRRLLRLIRHHGGDPVPVACSATIGEPGALMRELTGVEATVIGDDAAPRPPLTLALWDTPVPPGGHRRISADVESARITAELIGNGLRTLTFCRSRRGAEQVALDVADRLGDGPPVRVYRAGLLPEERRIIEEELASGQLGGIVATSALELGIDVGGLDAVVLDGFPGTVSSFRQRIGRVGRTGRPALAVLVAGSDQLDRWMLRHPDQLLDRPAERVVANVDNPFVVLPHLACAAYELPLRPVDRRWWPAVIDDGVRHLVQEGYACVRNGRAVWQAPSTPAQRLSLRSDGGGSMRIVDTGLDELVGTVDAARVTGQLHPGARYLHQGRAYRVDVLDLDAGVVEVRPDDLDERTRTRRDHDLTILDVARTARLGELEVAVGTVRVTEQVLGYRRIDDRTGESLGEVDLELPASELVTTACWFTVDDETIGRSGVDAGELPGALHAAEHAMIGVLPLFTICDRWDVGGLSTARHGDTGRATVVVHDGHQGGAGVAELAFDRFEEWIAATIETIAECGCDDGCPGCVVSPKCGNGNEPLDKAAALRLLEVASASRGVVAA
ncbi:MAG: DEAD/DEAH box helicase [Actinomycetota bacterium]